jgi:amidohydrolase
MTLNICPEINAISNEIISTRRDFHKHPELAFNEHRSAKIIAEKLTSFGLDVQTGVGKTGVVGVLNPTHTGKTIALRADMDALPIQETGDVEYASQNEGIMHACGHDGHMAMLLGAAKVLSEKSDAINGKKAMVALNI